MDKEKELILKPKERPKDPVLVALEYWWIQRPSGVFVPEKKKSEQE